MKTLPDTIDLDYLTVFPGYFDTQQNKRAVEQLHALIQQGLSLVDIANLAHQHVVEHQARLLTFNRNVTSGDKPDQFHRLVMMRLNELLLHPGAASDFIEVVCRERVVLPAREFLMASYKHKHDASMGRDANHQVFSSKKLGFVSQSKTIIHFFMANFIRSDDLEALKVYLTVPKVRAHYPEERASVWLRSFAPAPGSVIDTHFFRNNSASIIHKCAQYVADLQKIGEGFLPIKDYTFNQGLNRKVGHEVILELMGNMRFESKQLLGYLIRQGADWHLAVQMHMFGRAAYYDFVDRTVDLEAEVLHLIQNRREIPAPFPPILFEVVGENFMIKLAKDHGLADMLWKSWRLAYLIDHVSEKHREEILGKDLGL
jgi:hypothetical protein